MELKKLRQLNIKIPNQELAILNSFSEKTDRTKTNIIREFIRSLENKGETQNAENIAR